jgi:hypothetical protein
LSCWAEFWQLQNKISTVVLKFLELFINNCTCLEIKTGKSWWWFKNRCFCKLAVKFVWSSFLTLNSKFRWT